MKDYVLSKNNVRVPAPLRCGFTTVEISNAININDVLHSGTIAHKCSLNERHGEWCLCKCGYQWKGWGKNSPKGLGETK